MQQTDSKNYVLKNSLVQETLFADKFFLTVILPLKLNIPKTEPMSFNELLSSKPLTLLLTFFVIPRREV